MKRKVLSLAFAMVFVCSASIPVFFAHAEEAAEESGMVCGIIYDTDAYTQSDFDEHFQNYALSDATVDLSSGGRTFSDGSPANVVGIVKDYSTDEFVIGATVSIDGEIVVSTGADGRFQIRNFPSGVYDWEINAEGYCEAYYYNYDVHSLDGTTIFTFFIDRNISVSKDREEIWSRGCGQAMPPDTIERGTYATSATVRAMSSVPSVKNKIRVEGIANPVDRQEYIARVVMAELYDADHYAGLGMDNMQTVRLFRAQAVAANTFVEYALSVYSKHSDKGYDVCTGSCCQNYDFNKVTEIAIDAAAEIFYTYGSVTKTEILFYKPSSTTYEYIWGAYFSSCYGQGTLNYEGQPALRAVSCVDIEAGHGGERRGMCQAGAAKRIKMGDLEDDVLMYYYKNCSIEICEVR